MYCEAFVQSGYDGYVDTDNQELAEEVAVHRASENIHDSDVTVMCAPDKAALKRMQR